MTRDRSPDGPARSRPLLQRLRGAVAEATGLSALNDKVNRLVAAVQRLEHFSHGARATYLGGRRVLVRTVVGDHVLAFIVEADDRLLNPVFIATGRFEPHLTDHLVGVLKPGGHALDLGANFGYFTCLMSHLCPGGKVIGVEPDAHVHALARDNLVINSLSQVGVARLAAVGDSEGPVTLYRRTGRSGNTSIAAVSEAFTDVMGEPPVIPFTVAGVRVDDLLAEFGGRLDVMKVDVEGAEPLVFRGAKAAVAANPQLTVLMEWSPGQIRYAGFDVGEFLSELQRMGLEAFDLGEGALTPLGFDALAQAPYRAGVVLRRR